MINYIGYKEKNNEYYSRIRGGNFIYVWLWPGCPEFTETILTVNDFREDVASYQIDYPDSGMIESGSSKIQDIYPIPINSFWRCIIEKKVDIPSEIKYVHEFQNWYSINQKRKEFEFYDVEMTDGDNVATHQLERMLREDMYSGEQLKF